jgi:hypothetical protein
MKQLVCVTMDGKAVTTFYFWFSKGPKENGREILGEL